MNLDAVITQLKTVAMFGGNVAGAAAFADGIDSQVWLPTPAAYVIPLDEDASENQNLNGLQQIVTERIGIIVNLDNSADRRGQTASDQYDTTRTAIFKAILNWRPDWHPLNPELNREARGFYYQGGRLLDFDRARLFYQWEFALDITITDQDGWQPPAIPLLDITIHADLENIYSPTGAFVPSPDAPHYTPTTSPRTTGPDGRDEGALNLPLTGG